MARELQPEIFNSSSNPTAKPNSNRPATSVPASEGFMDRFSAEVVQELAHLKKRIRDLEQKQESDDRRFHDAMRATVNRLDRLQAQNQRLEEYIKGALHDVTAKVSTFAGRLTERKASEAKMEEVVDRHNQIVQKFELKMSQLQRLISEQELKLVGYRANLEDLRRHIVR